jgi:hypothetical protein
MPIKIPPSTKLSKDIEDRRGEDTSSISARVKRGISNAKDNLKYIKEQVGIDTTNTRSSDTLKGFEKKGKRK